MVGFGTHEGNVTAFDFMFAGAASGLVTRTMCQPFDVLKIRFQLQVEPISKTSFSKYQSIPQAVKLIYKEEGITSFWKGLIPAQLLSVVYGLVQFSTFEILTRQAHSFYNLDTPFKPLANFSCGALAGCAATVVSFPFDVIRTRLVAQSEKEMLYRGINDVIRHIVRNESILGFYRGLLPTFIQVAPHTGMQFMSFKLVNHLYMNLVNIDKSEFTLSGTVISGSMAGLIAKTSIYPFDLVRKRMQIQGVAHHRQEFGAIFLCRGMMDCFLKIHHKEGILGLFKGLQPSLLKAVATTTIHFTTYEWVTKLLSNLKL